MKNKVIVRVTSVVISLILATILLLSVIIPSLGKSYAYDAQYIRQFTDSLITNRNQYFDSSVVYELPSGVKDTDEISVIISLSNPALLDELDAKIRAQKDNLSSEPDEFELDEDDDDDFDIRTLGEGDL